MTIRLSDPKPAYCSVCLNNPVGLRVVDFDVAHDGGAFVDRETQAYIEGSDDLHICEPCLKTATEVLGLKAELNTRQRLEIGKLERDRDEWKEYAQNLEGTLNDRPDPAPSPFAGRRRKVSV